MLENHERVVITNNGRGAAVIINFEDYAAYEEYMHEKTVSERLEKALKSLHDPSVRLIPQDEVWAKLESKWGVK